MDDARYAPIVGPEDAEESAGYTVQTFESDAVCGSAGASANAHNALASITVDVPAVGVTPAGQLPSLRPGRDYVVGEVPQTLRSHVDGVKFTGKLCSLCGASRLPSGVCSLVPGSDGTGGCPDPLYDLRVERTRERDGLLSQLLFATHDLAESRLIRPDLCTGDPSGITAWCLECQQTEREGGLVHTATCKAGRALDLLARITDANQKLDAADGVDGAEPLDVPAAAPVNLNGKEAAAEVETERAGDGIRTPVAQRIAAYWEPWGLVYMDDCKFTLHDRTGGTLAHGRALSALAERIWLCVNFCAGISDDVLRQVSANRSLADYGVLPEGGAR